VAVRVERSGPVFTVVLDRPERRNAVDREHADALADASPPRTTTAVTASTQVSSGAPPTAHSRTAGCAARVSSTSRG
jgi:hypothetical protein